jgi:hypothetical protein
MIIKNVRWGEAEKEKKWHLSKIETCSIKESKEAVFCNSTGHLKTEVMPTELERSLDDG